MIEVFVRGIPYARNKTKGRLDAPKEWTQRVIDQTRSLPHIRTACELDAEFVLPEDKFPSDLPFGMDLDNLLKRLLDGLGRTVLIDAPGNDSAIVSLRASKRKARPGEDPGVKLRLAPVL